jgi:hypothetical protein
VAVEGKIEVEEMHNVEIIEAIRVEEGEGVGVGEDVREGGHRIPPMRRLEVMSTRAKVEATLLIVE